MEKRIYRRRGLDFHMLVLLIISVVGTLWEARDATRY